MEFDTAAEQAVLTSAIQSNDNFHDIDDIITENSFLAEQNNGLWWKVIKKYYEQNPEGKPDNASLISIANSFNFHRLNDPNELMWLQTCRESYVDPSNIRLLAGKIRKLEIKRDFHSVVNYALNNLEKLPADQPLAKIFSTVEDPIFNFVGGLKDDNEPKPIGSTACEYLKWLAENQRDCVGISTGYPLYDEAIGGGFRRKTVNVLAARLKSGKSVWTDNVGLHIAGKLNVPVLNLDTELSSEDHQVRILANLSEIPIGIIERGKFKDNREDARRIWNSAKHVEQIPYDYLSIAGQPFEETVSLMRRWVKKRVGFDENGNTKPCLIIFDYIKLMDAQGLSKLAEYQALGFLMTGLHNFAVKHDAPIFALAQTNRQGIDGDSTDVIAGSDRIGWLCSNLSLWKDKSPEEMASNREGNKKLAVIAARHGEGTPNGNAINYEMIGKYAKIRELGYLVTEPKPAKRKSADSTTGSVSEIEF